MAVPVQTFKLGKNGVVELNIPAVPLFFSGRTDRGFQKASIGLAEVERDHVDLMLQVVSGHVAEATPRDTGLGAQGWQSEIMGTIQTGIFGGRVVNTLPHVAVLERGRRPGRGVSRAGQAAIARWVRRKLGLSGAKARSATFAIVWKIRKYGLKPRNVVARGMAAADPQLRGIIVAMRNAYASGLMGVRIEGAKKGGR